MMRFTREQLAARVAHDIPEGAYVNLGIGLPTMVANYLPKDREIFLHSENGLLGMGPAPKPGEEDPDLINAGKQPVTLLTGGAYFHQLCKGLRAATKNAANGYVNLPPRASTSWQACSNLALILAI